LAISALPRSSKGRLCDAGVDDAQLVILGVEAQHAFEVAPLDAELQGFEVQPPLAFRRVIPCSSFLCYIERPSLDRETSRTGKQERYETHSARPLPAFEKQPDKRQEIRQLHDGRFQKRIGAEIE
jgi:hypothetical protein